MLKGKAFLGGSRPGAEDAYVYAAASDLPAVLLRSFPAVKGWLNTVGMFVPSIRASWVGGAPAPSSNGVSAATAASMAGEGQRDKGAAATPPPAAADEARAVKVEDDDDEMDDLFGDDEEEKGAVVPESGTASRAEKMAAAKAEKDKKKKVDRCVKIALVGFQF